VVLRNFINVTYLLNFAAGRRGTGAAGRKMMPGHVAGAEDYGNKRKGLIYLYGIP